MVETLGLVGLLAFVLVIVLVKRSFASKRWPTTTAEVIRSRLAPKRFSIKDPDGDSHYKTFTADIAYRYRVGGQDYESSRVRMGDAPSSNRSYHERQVANYPEGERVTVFYDPTNPERAVLEPGPGSGARALVLAGVSLGLGLTVISCIGVLEKYELAQPRIAAKRWSYVAASWFKPAPPGFVTELSLRDVALRQCLADQANANGWTEMSDVNELSCQDWGIQSLEGIASLGSLEALYLQSNRLTDVKGLAGLEALATLNISGNPISSLAGMRDLPSLTKVVISDTEIESLEGLKEAPSLARLTLRESQVSSLDPLLKLDELEFLFLYDNPVDCGSLERVVKAFPKAEISESTECAGLAE